MASYTLHIQYVDRPAETRTFTQAKITFGRDAGDVVLHDSQVSGRHGEITFDGNTLRFTDVGSTNGSFLIQGQRVANIELTPGIALRLGNSLITVQAIDAPNVAGKGRTVIAGPGMAPGFPAPMRAPPGPGPVVAAGAPIPRPPAPQPVAPGAPPPAGGFAFAPTAQMQSPVSPGLPPSQQPRPAFSAAPPQPGGPQAGFSGAPPQAGFSGAPPQPVFAPQPVAPQPPGPPPGSLTPQPVAVAPEPEYAPTPIPSAPEPVEVEEEVALAPQATPQANAEPPKDLVAAVKQNLGAGWGVVQPVFVNTVLMAAAVFVPLNLITALYLMIFPVSLWGIMGILVSLAKLAGFVILIPSLFRYVLGAHLGVPIEPKAAVQETVAKVADRAVNCFIPYLVFGVLAAPIYYVENKKVGEVISRNFALWGKDWVTIIVSGLAFGLVFGVASTVLGMILGMLPLGLLLAQLFAAIITSVGLAFYTGLSSAFYFSYRRRFEGGDPEAEGRAALTAGQA